MIKKNIISFDEFINPCCPSFYTNKKLDFYSIDFCSYVKYLVVEHCNGEFENNYFCVDYSTLIDYYNSSYIIFAINYLDNLVCEVV